eukprot:TRINITY_DN12115_c0_g1_i3.p1 TRINITY_DN12115_c0_g1~~TRINITY_DN12115_c0_g1_i3.p1  ORF type:complete len:151 (+),score=40.11 TRINITY_DN12115_c0_g1_i3:414-866(+)
MIFHKTDPTVRQNAQYSGLWIENMPHGQGLMLYEDGSSYDGDWEKGLRSGNGKMVRVLGKDRETGEIIQEVYLGQFKDDFFHGNGTLTNSDTSYYKGQWFKGKRQGRGEMKKKDGMVYIGYFNDDEMAGPNMQQVFQENEAKPKINTKST